MGCPPAIVLFTAIVERRGLRVETTKRWSRPGRASVDTVRSLISGKSFLLTHCHQIYIRKEISRPGFLDVSRYNVVHSIDLRRGFLRYVNIMICKFEDSVSCPGLYSGLYGQNLPYKFKNSYDDFRNRNFEKSHRTTGSR